MLTSPEMSMSVAPSAPSEQNFRSWLRRMALLLGVPLFLSVFTANPLLTAFSIVVAGALVWLLWRTGEPPVLLFCCALQWLQVTTVLHYANFARANLVAAFGGTELEMAVGLGLVGLIALALGARLGMGQKQPAVTERAEREKLRILVPITFLLYVGSLGLSSLFQIIS